jgi:hydroxymethylpyrimidine pyrophosphatase-like HAD family hydrolase
LIQSYLSAVPGGWVGLEIGDRAYTTLRDTVYDAELAPDIRTVAHQPTAKIYFQLDEYRAVADQLGPLPNTMRVLISEKYNIAQIMPVGVSKAAGLAFLVARWGLTLHDVSAFGDDTNDLEMVQEAGMGVAMGNAVAELKAVANRVTLTNDEDGVAVVVEEYLDA